jgi:serine/threonine protein kinase
MAFASITELAKLNRDVAIKVLPAALANDTQYMARFEREAPLLAALNHPNIATVYGIEQGALVMELVEGAELKGPLPLDEAIAIARQIAVGLEAAHGKGIIHRNLKPANVPLTPAGVVKILDFGLAKSAEPFEQQLLLARAAGRLHVQAPLSRPVGTEQNAAVIGRPPANRVLGPTKCLQRRVPTWHPMESTSPRGSQSAV